MTATSPSIPADGDARARSADPRQVCDRPSAVTRSLLGYGPLAGAVYLVSGVSQGLIRRGFDFTRHDLSLLANGPLGWIQVTTLVLSGLMTVAAAVGMARALRGGRGRSWAPRLIGGYGLALVCAGIFVADPMDGFPVGTPAGPPAHPTTSGLLHLAAGGIGFACLVAGAIVLGRRFASEQRRGWAWASWATGIVVLAGFVGIASGSTSSLAVLGLWIGVVTGWAWLAAVAVHLYRRTPDPAGARG